MTNGNIYVTLSTIMRWKIEFYKTKSGKEPVKDFIRKLSKKEKAKVVREIELLENKGIYLEFPKSSNIKGYKKLRELRIRFSNNQIRIIYFLFINNTFILLHGFRKKQGPIPKGELEIALRRMEEY